MIVAKIVLYMIKLLGFTYRKKVTGLENLEKAKNISSNGAFTLSVWHEFIIAGLHEVGHKGIGSMVSKSKDGEMIAWVAKRFGMITYRGSSSRGGAKALAAMIMAIKKGGSLILTVDGPRGPRRKIKRGIIEISYKTKTPIVPFVVVPRNSWVFTKSWDHFNLPKPFSRIDYHYGEPIMIDDELYNQGMESVSQYLEDIIAKIEENIQKEIL